MSELISKIKTIVQNKKRTIKILFTEGWNADIQTAAITLSQEGIIEPILLVHDEKEITKQLTNVTILNISTMDLTKYKNLLLDLRKTKGLTEAEANKLVTQPNYLSALMLKLGEVDGCVCGIEYSTKDTLRAALQIVKKAPDASIVTSLMVMEKATESVIFADISLNLNPNAEELANITKEVVKFAHYSLEYPNLNTAMLSYSTRGSGAGESVDKVKQAFDIVSQDTTMKEIKANIFGEIQFDAAYVPNIRNKKAPDAPWTDNPTIYIFPTLDAGNIGYKIMERCGGFSAVGPIIVGLEKPMNDLSRGASISSVIDIAYITAAQVK